MAKIKPQPKKRATFRRKQGHSRSEAIDISSQEPISPLAPSNFPEIPQIPGVRLAVGAAGIQPAGRKDLLLVELGRGTAVGGALTRSKTRSAPVDWCARVLKNGKARALIANSGNANAFTGKFGAMNVRQQVLSAAKALGTTSKNILVASTGVIGEQLPHGRIEKTIERLVPELGQARWLEAANAIRTTDTYAKGSVRIVKIGDVSVTIAGIAKGSGMIAPDLGTMFAFVFTDAKIPPNVLQKLVSSGVVKTFNAITVDSDTSTSDTVLVFATGQGKKHSKIITAKDSILKTFRAGLNDVFQDLAQQIICDGEGATKFITIQVSGAKSSASARKIGFSIANSPLVKTAISGEDPNWGRVVMAVGKSGERADRDRLSISFGPHIIAQQGQLYEKYSERLVANYMKGNEIQVFVDVGIGSGQFTVWTCDLSQQYITINTQYRS